MFQPRSPDEPFRRARRKTTGGFIMADNAGKKSGTGLNVSSRVMIVMGSLILVALVGVIVALAMVLNNSRTEEPSHETRSVVVNEDNAEAVYEEMVNAEPVEVGYYEAKMSTTWHFPDGTSPSYDAYVENVPENSHDVYFDVELRTTGEVIYASPVIPRGLHLKDFALDTDLDAGTYDCVIHYYLVDAEQREVDSLLMAVQVVVEG
jgi:hypothetical protein